MCEKKSETTLKIWDLIKEYNTNDQTNIIAQLFIKLYLEYAEEPNKDFFLETTSWLYDSLEEMANIMGVMGKKND